MPVQKKPSRPGDDLPVPIQLIERRIYLIRGQKVMLDRDLAEAHHPSTTSQTEFGSLPGRLHVSTDRERGRDVGISKCDTFKKESRRLPSVRIYAGGSSYALQRSTQRAIQVNVAITLCVPNGCEVEGAGAFSNQLIRAEIMAIPFTNLLSYSCL
jgi:hypothetical protein